MIERKKTIKQTNTSTKKKKERKNTTTMMTATLSLHDSAHHSKLHKYRRGYVCVCVRVYVYMYIFSP